MFSLTIGAGSPDTTPWLIAVKSPALRITAPGLIPERPTVPGFAKLGVITGLYPEVHGSASKARIDASSISTWSRSISLVTAVSKGSLVASLNPLVFSCCSSASLRAVTSFKSALLRVPEAIASLILVISKRVSASVFVLCIISFVIAAVSSLGLNHPKDGTLFIRPRAEPSRLPTTANGVLE